jgi:hypothetical protein
VVPVLLAGVVGVVVGAARRPHGRHLLTPTLVLPSVAVVGAGLQVLMGITDLPAENTVFAVSLALLSGFAIVNRHLVGMGVLAIGLSANFAAVLLHDGMPVRATALVEAGAVDAEDLADVDLGAGRRFERTDDLAPILGDVIPVAPVGAAMSFGDLIALMGVGTLTGELTRYARRGSRTSARTLATEIFGKVRTFVEEERVVDVRTDVEVLGHPSDVVDPDEGTRSGAGERAHRGERARVPLQR